MASRRNQVLALSAIWVAVCGLGWHAYANVLPKYGLLRPSRPARNRSADQQAWQQMQKDQEEFFKQPVPSKLKIKVSRADKDSRMNMGGWPRTNKGGVYYYAVGQTMEDAYASLSGTPRWQISQAPNSDERWNIRIMAPASERKNLADAFMQYMNWSVRKMPSALPGYRFSEGTPPPDPDPPAPAGGNQRNRGGRFPSMRLADATGFITGRVNGPVEVDATVKDRKPPEGQELQINWGLPPEKFVAKIANTYGVTVKPETMETTSVLVYHPKYISQADLQKWSRDGKL